MVDYTPFHNTIVKKGLYKQTTKIAKEAGISTNAMSIINKNDGESYVSLEVIDKLCQYLEVGIADVVEIKRDIIINK